MQSRCVSVDSREFERTGSRKQAHENRSLAPMLDRVQVMFLTGLETNETGLVRNVATVARFPDALWLRKTGRDERIPD